MLVVAKEEATEDEGKGDSKPQTKEGQHSCERYLGTQQKLVLNHAGKNVKHVTDSARRVLSPDEEIEEEAEAKHNPWIQSCRL